MIIEARCKQCGETFNPHGTTVEDFEHWARLDGVECGGQGELQGFMLHSPDENPFGDLDPDELAQVADDDFDGDLIAAADHLRRLRDWYTTPES